MGKLKNKKLKVEKFARWLEDKFDLPASSRLPTDRRIKDIKSGNNTRRKPKGQR